MHIIKKSNEHAGGSVLMQDTCIGRGTVNRTYIYKSKRQGAGNIGKMYK